MFAIGGGTGRFDFEVFDSSDVAVTGLVSANFTKRMNIDGGATTTSITVTEIGNGRYTADFTVPAVTAGTAKYIHCWVLHATYAPRGWSEDFEAYNGGLIALPNAAAGASGGLPTGNASGQVAVASVTSAVVTDVWGKALTELSSVPGVTASILDALNWVFTLSRNKRIQTSSLETVYKNDGTTSLATSTKSDDGVTFSRNKYS